MKSERIDSMSIIYNMTGHQPHVTFIIASDNFLHAKIVNNRPNFTRMFRLDPTTSPKKNDWSRLSSDLVKKR
jgi:hypothetical protein